MYLFCVYIPETHLEKVKAAIFNAGGGNIGDYDCCSWQVKGQGQFRPLEGSEPFVGRRGETETVSEYRLELVVEETNIKQVIKAMKSAHPYEEPAYHVLLTQVF